MAALFAIAMLNSGCALATAAEERPYTWALSVRPDGKYLLIQEDSGASRVWSLESRRPIGAAGPSEGRRQIAGRLVREPIGLSFLGTTDDVIVSCGASGLCLAPLSNLAEQRPIASLGDADDLVMAAISSLDGRRVAAGTLQGRYFVVDLASGNVETKKPKDIWEFIADTAYLLEGDRGLNLFVTATSDPVDQTGNKRDQIVNHPDLGYQEWPYRDASKPPRLLPLWRWPVVWRFDGKLPAEVGAEFSWRLQGDISADGAVGAICDSSDRFVLFRTAGPGEPWDEYGRLCIAVRFMSEQGDVLAALGDERDSIFFGVVRTSPLSVEWGGAVALRHRASSGRRVLVALPEKRWVFVGLEKGGADWYEYVPGPPPKLRFIATLNH